MAEPDWNPDTAGRSLAEILREAGIEAPRSGRRGRRWEDEDTGIRQRRAEAPAAPPPDGLGRRASDLRPGDGSAATPPRRTADPAIAANPPMAADPSTAAIPGMRPSRTPEVPGPATPPPGQPDRRASGADRRAGDRRSSERDPSWAGPERRVSERRTGDRRDRSAPPPAGSTDRPGNTGRVSDRPLRSPADRDHASTGPIPVVRDGAAAREEDAGPRESALAWLRFAGELVIALALGIGVYFLATVLWEQVPQLAVFLAPLAVTGLVAGVSVWRQRLGREPVGARLLAVLVFAGALLTVAPAAGLLAAG